MLSIWIGRAGAGKSRRVLETMARQRSQRPQVLLVPEHISHEAEVDLCRALGPTASRDAEVLSFQSLGSRVLARTGGLAEFTLDGGGKLLTMRLALQELHSRLKVFGRPSQRAAFLRQLTDLTEEFYAYEITPQALWQQVEDMEGAMATSSGIWRCCMPPMTGSSMPRAWTPGPGSRSCGTGWRRAIISGARTCIWTGSPI